MLHWSDENFINWLWNLKVEADKKNSLVAQMLYAVLAKAYKLFFQVKG